MLVGRHEEQRRIEHLLDTARSGESAVLVLRGEAGIGKTALLEHAALQAPDLRVLRVHGIESESELVFSGLLELLRPVLADAERLPDHQATALRGALALEEPAGHDAFVVYTATLGLLALVAEAGPLLVLADDAHWLDRGSAEALAFTCRRLGSEGIAVLWATRDDPEAVLTDGLDELRLDGLDQDAALELVSGGAFELAPDAARALVDLTSGNPLALLELPAMLPQPQRDGLAQLEQPLPASPAVQRAFGRRLEHLPEATRRMLLISAVSDAVDPTAVHRAWLAAGLDLALVEPAERAGLVHIADGQLEFRHPLVRAAVHADAAAVERREAHRALADVLVDSPAQDSRAWHLALASVEPDESIAAELENAARRARGQRWYAAAHAYERAARLTPEDSARARRLLEAATEWDAAGRGAVAQELVREARGLTDDPLVLADLEHLSGRITVAEGDPTRGAELLERAAERIAHTEPARAALILGDAAEPWLVAGDLDRAERCARRAWELCGSGAADVVLWVSLRYGDVLSCRAEIEQATELWLKAAELGPTVDLRARLAGGEALYSAGEDERARETLEQLIAETRAQSSLGVLLPALHLLSLVETRRGRLSAADTAATEAHELAVALSRDGERLMAVGSLTRIDALLGRDVECRRHVAESFVLLRRRDDEITASSALGMLELSLAHYDLAISHFEAKVEELGARIQSDAVTASSFVPGLIEAYVYAGRPGEARAALEAYEAIASRSGRPSAIAPGLRCRGLVAGDERFFEAALLEHDLWGNPFDHARTQLAYGELLRRRKRRREARVQLRAALVAFEDVGARLWAERARVELGATGESARRRVPSTMDELTPQERNVGRLVCDGLTNREIAEGLFLSPKTIETHLGHVFRKLNVRSRTELAVALARSDVVQA